MKHPGSWPTLLLLGACTVGVDVADFRPAQEPGGVRATLYLERGFVRGNRLEGELLAAGADGLVLLVDRPLATANGPRSLIRVPLMLARSVELEQMGRYAIRSEGSERDRARLARLALVSRYPQGIDARIESALLAGLGQPAIHIPERIEAPADAERSNEPR